MTSKSLTCLLLALLIGLAPATSIFASPLVRQDSDQKAEDDSADKPKAEDPKKEDAKEPGFADMVNEKLKPVDKWFGDYLVTPLETVFFFDFFTGPRYDSGQEFDDANGNGKYDEGETLKANQKLTVKVKDSDRTYEVTTDAEGKWKTVRSTGWLGVSLPFVVIWLLAGAVYLTLKMGFINVRAFWHAIRLTKGDYDDDSHEGEVSHFQALSSALSATVGLGNIAGVALAIGAGGPGATFWMIIIGLLGMSSKFTECTLAQIYRKVDPETGKVSGGPMRYLKLGLEELGMKWLGTALAIFFTILCIGASLGGGNAFQVGQSLDAIRTEPALSFLDSNPWIYGIGLAIAVGVVIVGGIKSIGKVAGRIVPFMCVAYVLMALYIIFTNIEKIAPAFQMIIGNAFSLQAGFGAILGVMVVGIQRAVFSNEAGTGSAAIAHSAAKTEEPVSEGIVALLEPFIDTVVVCTMTAIVIIIAGGDWVPSAEVGQIHMGEYGQWENPEYSEFMKEKSGAALTVSAVSGKFGLPWFKYVLYAAVVMFAYSTLISWFYYGERSWTSLFGEWSSFLYKILFLVFTVLGSIVTRGNILAFSDLLILSMAIPNILGLFILSGLVRNRLDDYMERLKSGKISPKK